MKGIILAGGSGSRLYPITKVVTKQLLPVYDKPMIYYPLSTLMLAGIKDILIICKQEDVESFHKLLGDGSHCGLNIQYEIQDKPNGIAEAFIIGENFIGDDDVCLILGDNLFYGHRLPELLSSGVSIVKDTSKAVIFGYPVKDPKRYGIVKVNKAGHITSIEEKPKRPKSNCAVVGLYMFDNSVVEVAKNIDASERGELEITAVNNVYLDRKMIELVTFGRGYTWFDSGLPESFLNAANYVQTIQERQGLKISCIEEAAYNMGFINKEQVEDLASQIKNKKYSDYLLSILKDKE